MYGFVLRVRVGAVLLLLSPVGRGRWKRRLSIEGDDVMAERRRVRGGLVLLLVFGLVASVLSAAPAAADGAAAGVVDGGLVVQRDVDVDVDGGVGVDVSPVTARGAGVSYREVERRVRGVSEESKRSGWERLVVQETLVPGGRVRVGGGPVSVGVGDERGVGLVRVNVLDEGFAGQLSPFGAAVSVDFVSEKGVGGVAPRGEWELAFDLGDVSLSDSGDVWERLTVTRFDGCEVFEPADPGFVPDPDELAALEAVLVPRVVCDSQVELDPVEVDVKGRSLTVRIDEGEVVGRVVGDRLALRESGVSEGDMDAKRGLRRAGVVAAARLDADGGVSRGVDPKEVEASVAAGAGLPGREGAGFEGGGSSLAAGGAAGWGVPVLQVGGGGGSVYGLTSSAASSAGDFSALPVPTLTDAQVGLFSGSAELSYPFPVPAGPAGPAPSVGLVYSSASVDGRTMGTNNQSGPVGVGWSLSVGGSIQRQLKACADPAAPGDRCVSSAPDEVYSLSLAGTSSKLVRVGSGSGYPKEFRLESDPFWRVRLWSGGSVNGSTVSTPDHLNEWWSVETPDGTVYTLGTEATSVDWLPVWYPSGGCTATYALCDTARQWNVDTVTDVFGNEMNYVWAQESNWYNARGISTTYKREYVRASRVESITYGGNASTGPNARMVLDYDFRCGESRDFGACSWDDGTWLDMPEDLWCGPNTHGDYPTVCTEKAPTFWSQVRFSGALSQVTDGAGGWVTVANHDPEVIFARDETQPVADSAWQNALYRVHERPVDGNGVSTAGGAYGRNGFNRQLASGADVLQGVVVDDTAHDIGSEQAVASVRNGDWIKFEDVWLGSPGQGATEVTLRYSAFRSGSVRIRLDSPTGPDWATVSVVPSTNKDFKTATVQGTAEASGVRDVYVYARRTANNKNFTLWQSIQFGRASWAPLPEVATAAFDADGDSWDYRNNRVNPVASAMRFPRIKEFINQLGGTVEFTYGQSNPCPAGKSSGWDTNDQDCFPQWDTSSSPNGFTVFNKWVVTQMTRGDDFSGQPDVVTSYDYVGTGWGFADNPDSSDDTWNEFRGYNRVTVTDAAGKTEHRFHQGLHGEPLVGSGTRIVNVSRSAGPAVQDDYALRGRPYEVRRLTTAGSEISRDWSDYVNEETTAGNDRDDPRFVAVDESNSRIDGTASTKTTMTFNDWGQPTVVHEHGSIAGGVDDERKTHTVYYPATTTTTLGAWRGTMPCITAVGDETTGAPAPAGSAAGFDRYSQVFYDANTSRDCANQVSKPVVARSEVRFGNAPTQGMLTQYRIDGRGRVDRVTRPEAATSSTVTTTFDPVHGQVVQTRIDAKGWTTSATYDVWRRPVTSTNINNRTTTTVYDRYSRVVEVREPQDAGAATLKVTYNQDARPAWVQTRRRLDGNDYTNTASFVDGFGRSLLNRSFAPSVGENWVTAQSYDNAGRALRSSSQYVLGNDNVTAYEQPTWAQVPSFTEQSYDAASRPTITRTRKGTGTSIGTVFTTTTGYAGFTTSFTDRNGGITATTVDGLGRTVDVTEQALAGNPDTEYGYNTAGDLLTVTAPDGLVTTIGYDLAGRKTTMSDPDSGSWTYGYDLNSNLTSQTDPLGTVLTMSYDSLDRLTHRHQGSVLRAQWMYDYNASSRGAVWDERNYDTNGWGVVYTRTFYDADMRVTQSQSLVPKPQGQSGRFVFRTKYSLRSDGQPSTVHMPSGVFYEHAHKLDYSYNPRTGHAEGVAEQAGSGGETIVESINRNAAGQVNQMLFGPGGADGQASWLYDAHSLRMTDARGGTTASPTAWQNLKYDYDGNGNITRIHDVVNAGQRQCFTYDGLDRLLTAYTDNTNACDGHTPVGAGNYDDIYSYDVGGNITSKTGNGTYSYANGNHAVTATSEGGQFGYDDNGNMTSRRPAAGAVTQTLEWDVTQNLEKVTDGTTSTEFLYDVDGQRVRRHSGDIYTFYADDAEYEWNNATGTGSFTWYHSIAGRTVAYTKSGSATTWMFQDQINSTALTRIDTGINSVQRYTPWGELRTNGNLGTDWHYTGQISDESTGLHYYNARYYEPTIARFVSPDSIVPNAPDGQFLNRYSYVNNRPTVWNDPSGHCPPNVGCDYYVDGWWSDDSNAAAAVGYFRLTGGLSTWAPTVESNSFANRVVCAISGADQRGCVNYSCPNCGHYWLEALGMLPVVGFVPDTINTIWYAAEGNWEDASLSGAAMVPGTGIFATASKWADELVAVSRAADAPSGLVDDFIGAACSFSGETEVLMADSTTKPISDVEIGDWVLSEDPETGERGARKVTHLWVHQDTIIDLEIDGHSVATTEDHPFWNHTDSEWQRADDLDAGDLVLTADGATLAVDRMDWVSARTTTAYNLTVDDIHTYFVEVGSDEVLVHNSNTCRDLWQLTREGAESTRRHGRFGTFYETVNRHGDSMWLTTDTAQHGGSFFKMYEETSTGLRWVADLDEYGDIIVGKHKSEVGSFIPWSEFGR